MGGRLENKRALITGAASGIGRATAVRFAQEGADICLADRYPQGAQEAATEIRALGRKAFVHQVDTSDEAAVSRMVEAAVKEMGNIDILIAAAGVSHATYGVPGAGAGRMRMLAEESFEDWRKVLSINLDGVFLTCRAVAAAMIKAGKGGRIINIASTAAKVTEPGNGAYAASKAGVWALTRTLAFELAPYNITANAIGPGMIKTPMTRDIVGDKDPWTLRKELNAVDAPGGVHVRRTLLNRFGEPRDVANTALFLAGEEGSYFTGSILHPDGGVALG